MGVYGKILHLLSNPVEISPQSLSKREFELDQSKSKNNIAENSVTLGHDTDNTIKPVLSDHLKM